MMNQVAILGVQAQAEIDKKHEKRKLKYKYNWQNAFRFVRSKIVQLINNKIVNDLIDSLIVLIVSSKIPVKPDRSFKRTVFKRRKNRLHQTYK